VWKFTLKVVNRALHRTNFLAGLILLRITQKPPIFAPYEKMAAFFFGDIGNCLLGVLQKRV
jgi:hypothetical protein